MYHINTRRTSHIQVLEGCVVAFSGLFPQSVSLYHSTAYSVATKLGARVAVNVEEEVTHLVASRLGMYPHIILTQRVASLYYSLLHTHL